MTSQAQLPPNYNPADVKETPLTSCLIQLESEGNDNAIGDATLTAKAYGPLQVRQPALDDVNKWNGTRYKAEDMRGNRPLSIWVFNAYMRIYATPKALGRPVTDEDRARIWNGGPAGWKHPNTAGYWRRVVSIANRTHATLS